VKKHGDLRTVGAAFVGHVYQQHTPPLALEQMRVELCDRYREHKGRSYRTTTSGIKYPTIGWTNTHLDYSTSADFTSLQLSLSVSFNHRDLTAPCRTTFARAFAPRGKSLAPLLVAILLPAKQNVNKFGCQASESI
jgi:hypothetical protein